MATQTCSDCHTSLPAAARYCFACGESTPLARKRSPEGLPATPEQPTEECPGCERPVEAAWLYCAWCGDRIEHLFHLQERGYSCGPAAIRNALALLGIRQDEPWLREVCGTKAFQGTGDEGFGRAAKALGLAHEHVVDGSLARLRSEVNAGNPCVLDWRFGAHYVCAFAVTDTHVHFVDSNPRDSGAFRFLTHERFLQLWWDDEDEATRHHAMHVFRRPPRS